MNRYLKVCLTFKEEIREDLESKKIVNYRCIKILKFNAQQFVDKGGDPLILSLYKYCIITSQCPVEKWVIYHKGLYNPYELIDLIAKENNITNIRYN